jgi:choline-sulfatase
LYEDCEHLPPEIAAMDYDDQDPHSRRIFNANDWRSFEISEDKIKHYRRACFANISYLDDKIGDLLGVLETTGQEATIIFVSDHGDMLGERGLWFKVSFFEGSSRVPVMISTPEMTPGLIEIPVSTLGVTPTLCDIARVSMNEITPWVDGESLLHLGRGGLHSSAVAMEYIAEASYAPMIPLRLGDWKYNRCTLDPV